MSEFPGGVSEEIRMGDREQLSLVSEISDKVFARGQPKLKVNPGRSTGYPEQGVMVPDLGKKRLEDIALFI